jgi:hypothetical protein
MIGIVQPDAKKLADACDARPDARLALDQRQRRGVDRCKASKAFGRNCLAIDVRNVRGQIAQAPFTIYQPGLFGPGLTIANQLHSNFLN